MNRSAAPVAPGARGAPEPRAEVVPDPVESLETEIEASRRRLDAYVSELDRRRHRGWPKLIGAAAGMVILALLVGPRLFRRVLSRRKDGRRRSGRRRWRVS